jgi:RimJ/RimL family protein N-acetyltransferase
LLLETARLLIRSFKKEDYDPLCLMMKDKEVMATTGFRTEQPDEKIKSYLEKWIVEGEDTLGVWAIEEKSASTLVGWIMLKKVLNADPELGYMIQKKDWGKGYATEACIAMIAYGRSLQLNRIVASTDPSNKSSIRVLEKVGMTRKEAINGEITQFEKVFNEKN